MLILAIETATPILSICVFDEEKVLSNIDINSQISHSINIIQAIDFVIDKANTKLNDINLISIDIGPGSFTSLRIGVATARQLAQVSRLNIVGISSLEVIKSNIPKFFNTDDCCIIPMIDARKNRIYCSIYNSNNIIEKDLDISPNELINKIRDYPKIIPLGTGYLEYKEVFDSIKEKLCVIDKHLHFPNSFNLAKLGLKKYIKFGNDGYKNIQPNYIRKSEAEINLEFKNIG